MKFGHTLRTSLNPDWTFHYVGKVFSGPFCVRVCVKDDILIHVDFL